ncbi:hypothetical protein GE061_012762 [Apolygus lucorum]|uniref:Uncharacterized protein n=1 Tax=Apolygus lucorum TaxID=248454 RepID=A0A6A4K2P5_APOLU|nr:hypothetical protein GE061_012762 [Apolygus lucorum]
MCWILGRRFIFVGALMVCALGLVSSCIFSAHHSDFPWIVRLMVRKTSAQLCVGNLVSEHFIMTPVSCYRRWSTLPKDYYSAKDLMVIAGRDDGETNYCSQERPGVLVTAHSNFSKDPHNNNIAILEVESFEFDPQDIPVMPFFTTAEENLKVLAKIQKDKPICYVPTFKQTKYLRNLAEDKESMRVHIVDGTECWNKFCPRGHQACLPFFSKKTYVCAQFINPDKRCTRRDVGAPLVCDQVSVGNLKLCRENRPMLFQGFNENVLDSMNRYKNMSIKLREYVKILEEEKKKPRRGKWSK